VCGITGRHLHDFYLLRQNRSGEEVGGGIIRYKCAEEPLYLMADIPIEVGEIERLIGINE